MGNKIVSQDSTPTDVAIAVGEIGPAYKKFIDVIEAASISGRTLHTSSENEISGLLDENEFKDVGISSLQKRIMLNEFRGKRTSSNPVELSLLEKKRTLDNAPLMKKVAIPKRKKASVVEPEAKDYLPKILMELLESPQHQYNLTSIFFDEEVTRETLKWVLEARMHEQDPNKVVIFMLYRHLFFFFYN